MALLFGLKAMQQDTDEANPHILGYNTARVAANSLLLDVWNAATSAGREFAVDLNGKMYSGALTAGDILYAVTGGVTGVRRLDSLAIGTANQVLQVNSGATAPEWSSSLSGLTLASPTLSGTVSGTPTWASAQAITLSTAAQPNVTSVGTLTGLTVGGVVTISYDNPVLALSDSVAASDAVTSAYISFQRIAVEKGWIGFGAGAGSLMGVHNTIGDLQLDGSGGSTITLSSLATVTGALTVSGLVTASAGLTVASGQTLTLTGATVTGAPTWSNDQTITLSTAAQPFITSVGTLTALTVDDITINGNTISSAGASTLAITPTAGQAITFDGTVTLDAGVIAGATSITSTTFVGNLTGNASGTAATVTGAAQPFITSVGTLSALTVTGLIQTTLTTQQLSLRYDASNHLAVTVSSAGAATFTITGSNQFLFFDERVLVTSDTQPQFQVRTTNGLNLLGLSVSSAGVVTYTATGASAGHEFAQSVKVNAAFGCNSATPQTAAASGGALAAYGAGANGLDSGANMSALHALVVAIRGALVANGIMS